MEDRRRAAELSQLEIKAIKDLEDTINRDRTEDEIVLVAYRDRDKKGDLHRQSATINPS